MGKKGNYYIAVGYIMRLDRDYGKENGNYHIVISFILESDRGNGNYSGDV